MRASSSLIVNSCGTHAEGGWNQAEMQREKARRIKGCGSLGRTGVPVTLSFRGKFTGPGEANRRRASHRTRIYLPPACDQYPGILHVFLDIALWLLCVLFASLCLGNEIFDGILPKWSLWLWIFGWCDKAVRGIILNKDGSFRITGGASSPGLFMCEQYFLHESCLLNSYIENINCSIGLFVTGCASLHQGCQKESLSNLKKFWTIHFGAKAVQWIQISAVERRISKAIITLP